MIKTETNSCKQQLIQVVVKDKETSSERTFSLKKGESVLSMLRREESFSFSHCGGRGVCGRCVVQFLKGAPLPTPADRRKFSPGQLRDGYRLACLAKPHMDCEISCEFPKEEMKILVDHAGNDMEDGGVLSGRPSHTCGPVFVAIDLGTTTIVMQLVEIASGNIIDTYTAMNPQRSFGTDVISRMQASLSGEREALQQKVKVCLENGMMPWILAGFDIKLAILAGNTVMVHLFLGLNVEKLAAAPFVPGTISEEKTEINGITTVIIPGISAFVGGDIMAGLLWCSRQGMQEKTSLLIDLGTNGEMALMHEGKLFVTATAAGPAFEGGVTAGVYGADVIAMVAKLLNEGILDQTGLMHQPYFATGITVDGVRICQEDVRQLQMAKAAVFAGIQILLQRAQIEVEEVQRVYLAGGFGYYLDVEAACRIGVLPDYWKDKAMAVGNTALAGAVLYGKEYAKGMIPAEATLPSGQNNRKSLQEQALELQKNANVINLAQTEEFNFCYISSMELAGRNPFAREDARN